MILRYIYINGRETTISVRNAVNCLLTSVMVWVPGESYSKFNSHSFIWSSNQKQRTAVNYIVIGLNLYGIN